MSDIEKKTIPVDECQEDIQDTVASEADGDVDLARRMLVKSSLFVAPAVLASFTVSKPVQAATCAPNLCNPGDSCLPNLCGPGICDPSR